MNVSLNAAYSKTASMEYPGVINFFRLRPELTWFLISYALLFTIVTTFKWRETVKIDESQFQTVPFEMVELKIQQQVQAAPEIVTEETAVEEAVEKDKTLKFGDDSGQWDISLGRPPQPLFTSMPQYPQAMKKAGIEGKVIVELGIDEAGKIVYGKVIKALNPILDMIVIRWIKNQKFTPAQSPDGKSFKAKIYLPVLFSLTD